jgi:hypothetical protein
VPTHRNADTHAHGHPHCDKYGDRHTDDHADSHADRGTALLLYLRLVFWDCTSVVHRRSQ